MNKPKGQILITSILFLSVIVLLVTVLVSYILGNNYAVQKRYQQKIAFNLAEAGIDKAIQEINNDTGFSGETLNLADGDIVTTVTPLSGNISQLEATSYYPSQSNPKTQKTVRMQIEINTEDVAFHYGVQVDEGGLNMGNNSEIFGNLYSNGSISGSGIINGTAQVATGSQFSDSHEVQSLGSDGEYRFGHSLDELDATQSFKPPNTASITMVSLKLKKKCQNNQANKCPSNLTIRILGDASGSPDKDNVLATGTLNQSLVSMNEFGWTSITIDTPVELTAGETYWITLSPSDVYSSGNTERYWWWAKDKNQGYGNGLAKYSPDWNAGSPSWTQIVGDLNFKVYMGADTTYIDGIHVTEDTYAYEIKNSTIDQEAYYIIIDDSTVGGSPCPNTNCHPDTPAPSLKNMPISEANINDWKNDAKEGEPHEGNYELYSGATAELGPLEITGDLILANNVELKVTGTIYVHGKISMSNNSVVYLDSSYGSLSGLILNDGEIDVFNNVEFCGSGWDGENCDTSNGSYIMLLSTSNKTSDSDPAIDVANNAAAVIFYASNGSLRLQNNAGLYEAVAYKLILYNNATITYESGLADASFSSGPGASWSLKAGSWQEL